MFLQVQPISPTTSPGAEPGLDIISLVFQLLLAMPMVYGAYKGYADGLLSEVVGLMHFVVAFLISFKVVGVLLNLVKTYIFDFGDGLFPEVVFACSVGASLALLNTLGRYLKTEIEFDFPGAWDNIIGAIVGIGKYAVVVSFFLWFIHGFGNVHKELKSNFVYQTTEQIALQMVGAENHDQISKYIGSAINPSEYPQSTPSNYVQPQDRRVQPIEP